MGERFGRYELLRRLGAGGMAEVFVAKTFGAEGFVKDLVIKRILPGFGEDPDFVHMFINEARLAARLQHANIVQIYDFNHVDGIYYIAMEWVDGLDLRNVFNTARRRAMALPLRLAVHAGVETLKGLHYAHSKSEGGQPLGLVHRDISPHNLLVSFAGEVKITDFGIAKAAAILSSTRSGAVKGKLSYMSPEQVSGALVDGRSDLFSLGVVLWELLAGQRLYRADSEGELFAKVRQAKVPRLTPLNTEVPTELERVLNRLLTVQPEERYQSAAEALGELSQFAQVDDALQVQSYLRNLVPDEATRDRRGETRLDPARQTTLGGFHSAALDPTRTQVAERALQDEQTSTTNQQQPVPLDPTQRSTSERVASETLPQKRPSRRILAAGCLGCFAAFALASHWLVSRSPTDPPSASITVDAEPAGASIWAEGFPLGTAPVFVRGRVGTELHVQARWQDPPVQRDGIGRFGSITRLVIKGATRTDPTSSAPVPPDPRVVGASARSWSAKRTPALTTKVTRKIRAAGRPVGWATLHVLVAPWARVFIDGEDRGQTPLKNVKLPAGSHTVVVSNPELGKRDVQNLKLRADEHIVVRRNWTP